MEAGAAKGAQPRPRRGKAGVFDAVQISFPLMPPLIDHDPRSGKGQGRKNILNELLLSRKCIVYAAGIADDSEFEERLARDGCEVHAFDCTVALDKPSVTGKKFIFHDWCLGFRNRTSFEGNIFAAGRSAEEFVFKTLSETMAELGHENIDLLKFDIEGFEWGLFEQDFYGSTVRPMQIAFELHTQDAYPIAVPRVPVAGRGFASVSTLFSKLFGFGYRVVSKELNNWDPACAEFVLLNVGKLSSLPSTGR
mmetsp:Transcript_2495/g.7076  ORF Transcript_2495/g.7076 Transcript_2495/m.7076 type:complete len:251 (-) Transcript_2495:171-923(-)